MDFSNIFRLINLGIGAIMVLGGVSQFFPPSISSVVVGVYVILFGLAVGALEFVPHPPSYLSRHASFLFSFIGRGICKLLLPKKSRKVTVSIQRHHNNLTRVNFFSVYIFVGCILIEGKVLRIIAGTIVGVVGLGYVALEFVPSIEPPPTMREADSTWGSEQV
ncbi:COPI-coated vesicle protein, variant [Blastomyces dermatitidis ATCC 18188]|uniref:COPI-coated vesicle protein, variant n=1 Tax=Ajellomyces dermatitidis (strain ATCC 18188 / CBS 674.68) TaxID=653446 RepID=A0A0J9HFC4_AJEDA|nr:COPI-coated vesicle protein, variant [Blastomyces dermatitidis ATCC 18188]